MPISRLPSRQRDVLHLYRVYLRQIRRLPLLYLRHYFRIKAADDVRAILRSTSKGPYESKMKRVSKDALKVEAALSGSTSAFAHLLDLAYGRKGKLKWEIMEPLLVDPSAPMPPRIISSVEKSRPPVYSPELKALLTSPFSRTTKPLTPKKLSFPPTLPARADPTSDEARLLGRLSKRREVNIRWRFFVKEWKKVLPPLQVVCDEPSNSSKHTNVWGAGIRGFGMQKKGVFEEILEIVGRSHKPVPTKKESRNAYGTSEASRVQEIRHPSRWLRRRYQELLGRIPILVYTCGRNGTPGNYSVTLSPNATAPSLRHTPSCLSEVQSEDDHQWLSLGYVKREKAN